MKRDIVEVAIELCHPEAILPEYARPGDSGMDICAIEDVSLAPGQTVIVKTGLKLAIPAGYEIQIRPRSGLSFKTPLRIPNSPGTIDSGYRDEVGIIMQNSSVKESCSIKKGARIAQMVLQRVPAIQWLQVDSVVAIGEDRGGGFGSSGV